MNIDRSDSATVKLVKLWIQDLVNTGMSYSRISMRLHLSPSTIQKIITKNRMPRVKTIIVLGKYYVKIFSSPIDYGSVTENYFQKNFDRINETLELTINLLKNLLAYS